MPVPADQIAEKALAELGERRRALHDAEEDLREDTRRLLNSTRGKVPRNKAAKLAGLNRSTVYELYLDD